MVRIALVCVLIVCAGSAFADTIEEKAVVCSVCHGANGIPEGRSIPIIWGQQAGYLYLDLRDFQKGARKNEVMTPIAQNLAREDLLALAEYFAAKPWPNTGAPAASKADTAVAMATNKSVSAPVAISNSSRAIRPFPASQGSSATTSSRRCSTSAAGRAPTTPACPA